MERVVIAGIEAKQLTALSPFPQQHSDTTHWFSRSHARTCRLLTITLITQFRTEDYNFKSQIHPRIVRLVSTPSPPPSAPKLRLHCQEDGKSSGNTVSIVTTLQS